MIIQHLIGPGLTLEKHQKQKRRSGAQRWWVFFFYAFELQSPACLKPSRCFTNTSPPRPPYLFLLLSFFYIIFQRQQTTRIKHQSAPAVVVVVAMSMSVAAGADDVNLSVQNPLSRIQQISFCNPPIATQNLPMFLISVS